MVATTNPSPLPQLQNSGFVLAPISNQAQCRFGTTGSATASSRREPCDAGWMIHSDYFARVFIGQIKRFDKMFSGTVFPPFADPEAQANRVAQDYWDSRMSEPVGEFGPDADSGDIADHANQNSIDFYLTMTAMQQTVLNLFTAGLFHLFEQQIGTLLEDRTGTRPKFPFDELGKSAFQDKAGNQVPFKSAPGWATLDELRLVANVVKHAEGDSANKLRAVNDAHFKLPSVRGTDLEEHLGERMLGEPLTGEGIYVVKTDYDAFVTAVVGFWEWIAGLVVESR